MKTLYIHIGTHKTGSSAIQSALKKSKSQLQDCSIFFDPVGYYLSAELMNSSRLERLVLERFREAFCQKYFTIREAIIVFSGEGFFGDPYIGYNNISAIADDLHHIFQDFDVRIIASIRKQDTFIESLYHQRIKEGGSCSFERFISAIDIYAFNWYRLLKTYESNFGRENLKIVPFEQAGRNGNSLIKIIFQTLGVDIDSDHKNLSVINPSYTRKGLEIARLCNPILDNGEQKKLRSFLEREFPKAIGEKFEMMSEHLRDELTNYYSDSNRKLFNKYISHYCDKEYFCEEKNLNG